MSFHKPITLRPELTPEELAPACNTECQCGAKFFCDPCGEENLYLHAKFGLMPECPECGARNYDERTGRNLIVHMVPVAGRSSVASVKITNLLGSILGWPVLSTKHDLHLLKERNLDTVIVVNSPSAFCPWLDDLAEIVLTAKRIVWVMNDYTVYPPTQLRARLREQGRQFELWSTLPELPPSYQSRLTYANLPAKATQYVNWNELTFRFPVIDTDRDKVRSDRLFYWGAYRNDRVKMFERYFDTNKYLGTVSCSARAQEKFADICGPDWMLLDPADDIIELAESFRATLYIQDKMSDGVYCSPANRFYEALSAGMAIFVDRQAVPTLVRAGFKMRPTFVCTDADDVAQMLPNWEVIREQQSEDWLPLLKNLDLRQKVSAMLKQEGFVLP